MPRCSLISDRIQRPLSIRLRSIKLREHDFWHLFWGHHPALALGLSLLFSTYGLFSFSVSGALLSLLFFSSLFFYNPRFALLCFFAAVANFGYLSQYYLLPPLSSEGITGRGELRIERIQEVQSHGQSMLLLQGTVLNFCNHQKTPLVRHGRFNMRIPQKLLPSLNRTHQFEGTLLPSYGTSYGLRLKGGHLAPQSPIFSLAELRWKAKCALSQLLKKQVKNSTTCHFLIGLATGEFSDKLTALEFSRFGLQHLMAISGFHFTIVAATFYTLLSFCVSHRKSAALAIFLLSSYYLFLGASPSIQRAWISSLVFLATPLFGRHSSPLNALGCALTAVLLYDPLQTLSTGFQFSFLITGSILLLYPPLSQWITIPLSLSNFSKKHLWEIFQHLILSKFQQGCALSLAVHLTAIPLTLATFHKFPLLSILFNLFCPFFAAVTLTLLIIALLATPFPLLASSLYSLNAFFTTTYLHLLSEVPMRFDFCIRSRAIPPDVLVLLFGALFLFASRLLRSKPQNVMQ